MPRNSKTKPVDEARSRLTEKLEDVRSKTRQLYDIISTISSEAIKNAELTLKETSKSKFLNKYAKSSQELEGCLNKLLLITDIAAGDESDEEGSSDEDEAEDEADENNSCITDATTTLSMASNFTETSTITLNQASSHSTLLQQDSVMETTSTGILHSPGTPSPGVLSKHDSQESFFSSVSTAMERSLEQQKVNRQLDEDLKVEPYKWESDTPYPVIVTNITTPWTINLQLADPNNDIAERLCMEFMKDATKGYKGGIDDLPVSGVFCCARSPIDDAWYRARVTEIIKKNDSLKDHVIKVYFIDEGFDAAVTLSSIRPLDKKFSSLPSQSFKCILGGIQPFAALDTSKDLSFDRCNSLWRDISINWLKELVSSKSLFAAYLYFPPKMAYDPPHCVNKDVVVCDLYMTSVDVNINWWTLSYSRPPIENHLAFVMAVEEIAAPCSFFQSELNRKKSLRLLKEKRESLTVKDEKPAVENKANKRVSEQSGVTLFQRKGDIKPCHNVNREPFQLDNSTIKKGSTSHQSSPNGSSSSSTSSEKSRASNNESDFEKKERKTTELGKNYEVLMTTGKNGKEKKENTHTSCKQTKRETRSKKENQEVNQQQSIKKCATASIKQEIAKNNTISTKSSSETADYTEKELATNLNVPQKFEFEIGKSFLETTFVATEPSGFAKIFVSEVMDPGLFYCHLVSLEATKLDELMEELNVFYEEREREIFNCLTNFAHEIGAVVAARFSQDRKWYRAIIVATREENEYNVLHVDFGSNEWTTGDCLLPISQQFCLLPMETIPCCLAGVKPLAVTDHYDEKNVITRAAGDEADEDTVLDVERSFSKWSDRSIFKLKQLLLKESVFMACLKKEGRNADGLYEVYVYDTTGDQDVFINQLLVDEGFVASKLPGKQIQTICVSEMELENNLTEDDIMAEWDPMTEQYLSKRNAYSVDIDDPAVATLGFVDKKKELCTNFTKRGRCYRGDDCRFLHVKPGDPSLNFIEVFCDNALLELPEIGDWVPITVSALFDPTHFWCIFPYGLDVFNIEKSAKHNKDWNEEALHVLNEQMNDYYSHVSSRKEKVDLTLPAEGELVACRFQDDNTWYRARIVNYADEVFKVFYIDYGNTDIVTEVDIRKLIPDFLHLPHQAVECFLHETELESDLKANQQLYDNIRNKFRDLTADRLLIAHIIDSNTANRSMVVELYDTAVIPNCHINTLVRSWEGVISIKKNTRCNKFDPAENIVKQNLTKFIPG